MLQDRYKGTLFEGKTKITEQLNLTYFQNRIQIKVIINCNNKKLMITELQIQKSYQSLQYGREPLPINKQAPPPSEWKVRFKYIWCQPYCGHCKKWQKEVSQDYCRRCGSDYYSHIDLMNNEIAPIRRGWSHCCKISLSLNQQLDCEACYYQKIGNKQKSQEINSLRLKAKTEVEAGEIYKQIQRIKAVRSIMFGIQLGFTGTSTSYETKSKLIQMITPEMVQWSEDSTVLIKLLENLWRQFHQKGRERYAQLGISF